MVEYHDDSVFPAPRETVWRLLEAHRGDEVIPAIHPLVLEQRTVQRGDPDSIVERLIDARGRKLRSRWKLTYRPPDYSRWEVLDGEGPWKIGSFLENTYTTAPGGTRIQSHGQLHIQVLPRVLPQGWFIRRVLRDIDLQDTAYLARLSTS